MIPDSRYYDLHDEPPPMSYAPLAQHPSLGPWSPIFVRAPAAAQGALRAAIRSRVAQAHPGVEIEFRVFEDDIRGGLLRDRLMAALSGFFGALAAVLATVGLYGVMSYIVARRRNEIGIRMAMGAGRGQVVGLVMREAVRMLATGVAIGTAGALALAHSASALLFGLKASDPLTLLAAAVLLTAASALGSFLPARRASRLDPMAALRTD
jgi:predicted lysophospholipase L1 biosynthesis ABC-type transport system permease subunit